MWGDVQLAPLNKLFLAIGGDASVAAIHSNNPAVHSL